MMGDFVETSGLARTPALLIDKTSGKPVNFDRPKMLCPLEYQDAAGAWKNFDNTGTRPRFWTGMTSAGRCGVVTPVGELWGKDQGPFKKPN
jgi:hypothetical protein